MKNDYHALADWPFYEADEIEAVAKILMSGKVNYWTGSEGRKFEAEFAAFCGTRHAIAVSNGTNALDLALHGLRIGARNGGEASDEVIVSPRSFVASASSIVNAGAKPVFADVEIDSQNISARTVEPLISANTRAVLCVHLAGWPVELDGMKGLVAGRGIKLIEDCAQAHGASYRGRSVGSFGDVAAWSFCQDKIMSTGGEGGMVTTSDDDAWNRMWSFKDHGKCFNAVYNTKHPPGFRWIHKSFGTNYRLTEMQSAVGRIQLSKLPEWTNKRRHNAEAIANVIADRDFIKVHLPPHYINHAWYRLYAFVDLDLLGEGWTRDRISSEINKRGVPCMQGSCPEIYREQSFESSGLAPIKRLTNATRLGETSLMFKVHHTLKLSDIDFIIQVLGNVLDNVPLKAKTA